MYIESVPNRNSPPAVLLRESYRQDGKVLKRTLANLSCLAEEVIEGLKVLLRGGVAVSSVEEVFTVERTLPHGHVAAVLRSEEHTSELQSRQYLVCRLLLEKKKE